MPHYSYHASHEQFSPGTLIRLACLAEEAGFDAVFCSDHLQPWATIQGHSGHAWAWLGAALQATRRVSFSTITVPGGWRYHPAVLAQAIGTLDGMFPGRLPWLAFGSGEALNEAAVGNGWPSRDDRHRRLEEGVKMIRALLSGERITRGGDLKAQDARIWEHPTPCPLLLGAAMSEQTAHWLGSWADGLLTLGRDLERLKRIIAAFRQGGGADKPVHVKVDVAWGVSVPHAEAQAHRHWRFACLDGDAHHDLASPEAFEAASAQVQPGSMHRHVLISHEPGDFIRHLEACQQLGVSAIDVHHVGTDQEAFIRLFGWVVLPALRAGASKT